MKQRELRASERFLRLLARALHTYGTPSHRLEDTLAAMSRSLGVEGQFLVTPTSIVMALGADEHQRTFLQRVEPGEVNLERLVELYRIMQRVQSGSVDSASGHALILACLDKPLPYPGWLTVMAFATASVAAAVLFGGGRLETLATLAPGLLIGWLAVLAARLPRLASVFPAMAAFIAALVPSLLAHRLGPMFPFISTLAGAIVLLPGLSLTIAVNELANRHLVSGTARLTGALVNFLQIGLGVAVGWQLAESIMGPPPFAEPTALPLWAIGVALAATAMALVVLFRARTADLPVILVAALVAYGGSRLGSYALGPEMGTALGAMAIGLVSNLFARLSNKPSALMLVPGMLLIVPGSVGLRSLRSLLENDVVSGIETAFSMGLLAVSLVTGLFLANLVLPSRRML